jgi:hypothetical protein
MSLLQQLLRLRVQPAPDGEPSMLVRETAALQGGDENGMRRLARARLSFFFGAFQADQAISVRLAQVGHAPSPLQSTKHPFLAQISPDHMWTATKHTGTSTYTRSLHPPMQSTTLVF